MTGYTESVAFPGGEIALRGLSLADVSALIRRHREYLGLQYSRWTSGESSAEAVIDDVLSSAPEIALDILRMAADAGPEDESIARLPAGVAIVALDKVAALTFTGDGGLGKVLEVLLRAAEGASSSLPISTSGSTLSEAA